MTGLSLLDFEGEYRTGRRPAVRRAYRLTSDRQAAEDIVQGAYLNLWRRRSNWQDRGGGRTGFVNTAVHGLVVDHLKSFAVARTSLMPVAGPWDNGTTTSPWDSARPVDRIADRFPDPARQAVSAEIGRAVRAAMRSLTEAQRTAVFLRFWLDLSGEQIAARLGLTVAATKALLFRGMRALERLLADRWSEVAT